MENPRPPPLATAQLFSLQNRTILITGGLGAIGTSITQAIMESGGDVICIDLPTEPNTDIFVEISKTTGQKWSYHSLDVTDSIAVQKTIDDEISNLRPSHPLRGVVTTAGISGGAPAETYPLDKFKQILDINVLGTFNVVQAVGRYMLENKLGGSVVMIASMSGSVANKGVKTAAYNTSKSAILQLARSLAAEWGNPSPSTTSPAPPIRVNSLSPGYIHTALSEESMNHPETREVWLSGSMLGRFSWAEEYRGPVLFLLGEASRFMTGADLRVDGGHCAW